jgi:hypothetical protein
VAAEDVYLSQKQIHKQSPAIERTQFLEIGTTSSTSGTSSNDCTEEVILSKGFGTFYIIREVYSIISSKKKFRNSFFEPRCFRLGNSNCECGEQTIYQSYTVDGSGVAAEGVYLSKKQIHKQNPAIERNCNLEIGTICLSSETNPKDRADLFSIVSSSRSLEKYADPENVYSDFNLPAVLDFPSNSNSLTHVSALKL